MDLKIDSEALGQIAAAAIFEQLSQDSRDTVIKQAIEYLLTPHKGPGYMVGRSPLQIAFETALQEAATKAVREKIADDEEIKQHINELLGPIVNKALAVEAEKYRTELADAIGVALGNWLAEQAQRGN